MQERSDVGKRGTGKRGCPDSKGAWQKGCRKGEMKEMRDAAIVKE